MSDYSTQWNKEDLEAYLLLYCANADFVETEEEKKFIHKKVSDKVYTKIHLEFINDNDYKRIQKIINASEKLALTKEDFNILFKEIEELFNADGEFNLLEKEIFIGLKRVLK